MAFQAGTTIRPELGNADYSGFANAASIQANSLAQLGATIGSAIQVAGEKKKEKALSKQAKEMVYGMLKQNPKQAAFFGLPEDFELNDVTPFVDVMRPGPTIAMVMQLNMASMKADTPSLVSVKEAQDFKEYVSTLTSSEGNDTIVKNGILYDEDPIFDNPLSKDDPAVMEALQTEVGRKLLYGYKDAEPLELNKDDETPDMVEPPKPSPSSLTSIGMPVMGNMRF